MPSKNCWETPYSGRDEDEEIELPIRMDSFDEEALQKAIGQLKNGKSCERTVYQQKLSSTSISNLPRQVKVNAFQTLVEPVHLYGSETWTLTKQALERRLDSRFTRFLRAAWETG